MSAREKGRAVHWAIIGGGGGEREGSPLRIEEVGRGGVVQGGSVFWGEK